MLGLMIKMFRKFYFLFFTLVLCLSAIQVNAQAKDYEANELKYIVQKECQAIGSVYVLIETPDNFERLVNMDFPLLSSNLKEQIILNVDHSDNKALPRYEEDNSKYKFFEKAKFRYGLENDLIKDPNSFVLMLNVHFDRFSKVIDPKNKDKLIQDMSYVILSGARYRSGNAYDNFALTSFATRQSTVINLTWPPEKIESAVKHILRQLMCSGE